MPSWAIRCSSTTINQSINQSLQLGSGRDSGQSDVHPLRQSPCGAALRKGGASPTRSWALHRLVRHQGEKDTDLYDFMLKRAQTRITWCEWRWVVQHHGVNYADFYDTMVWMTLTCTTSWFEWRGVALHHGMNDATSWYEWRWVVRHHGVNDAELC